MLKTPHAFRQYLIESNVCIRKNVLCYTWLRDFSRSFLLFLICLMKIHTQNVVKLLLCIKHDSFSYILMLNTFCVAVADCIGICGCSMRQRYDAVQAVSYRMEIGIIRIRKYVFVCSTPASMLSCLLCFAFYLLFVVLACRRLCVCIGLFLPHKTITSLQHELCYSDDTNATSCSTHICIISR